jgi:hypothetical protein
MFCTESAIFLQTLAEIRMLFDWLVTGQVVATNPAQFIQLETARQGVDGDRSPNGRNGRITLIAPAPKEVHFPRRSRNSVRIQCQPSRWLRN